MSGYNFTIDELCESAVARSRKINNEPSADVINNLWQLITSCLQPIRDRYGKPIIVSSGYRCAALNKAVGGAKTSQHTTGEAADIVGQNNSKEQLKKILNAALSVADYDQLILEVKGVQKWLHISHRANGLQRREVLYYNGKTYVKCSTTEIIKVFDGLD